MGVTACRTPKYVSAPHATLGKHLNPAHAQCLAQSSERSDPSCIFQSHFGHFWLFILRPFSGMSCFSLRASCKASKTTGPRFCVGPLGVLAMPAVRVGKLFVLRYHRITEIGRDIWGPYCPTSLLRRSSLEHITQDCVRTGS